MPDTGGTLRINGREISIAEADCDLFVGRVNIYFATQGGDGSICNIPYGDALNFKELANRKVTITDCETIAYDNILFKPHFTIREHRHSIASLHAANREHHALKDLLLISFAFVAANDADGTTIEVNGEITSQFTPLTRSGLLFRQEPIPIRFANHYLGLLGLPAIPNGATRTQVTSVFGELESEGGGVHPLCGYIQPWIRFAIDDFYLHCRFAPDRIIEVTFMPQMGLFSS